MQDHVRLFYDGLCPLCRMEIEHLRKLNTAGNLELQDINAQDFSERFPHIDPQAANAMLHAEYADGTMVYGVDATCAAWHAVGKGHWFAFLRWPLIKPVADFFYRIFARHRHRISAWVTRQPRCDDRCPRP